MKNKTPLTCMMKAKEKIPNITPPAIMGDCRVLDYWTDDTSPVLMEACVNDEHEDRIINHMIKENDTKVNDELEKS